MKNQITHPLHLPRSVKAEVERRAKQDGINVSQFVATAVAEKLAAMGTAEFLPSIVSVPILRLLIG